MSEPQTPPGGEQEEQQQGPRYVETVDNSVGPNEMASQYLPDSDAHIEKTLLDVNDPARVAALRNMGKMFPEVRDLQDVIDDFVDDFVRSRPSVGGESREEYTGILKSMYGNHENDDGTASKLFQALTGDVEDD